MVEFFEEEVVSKCACLSNGIINRIRFRTPRSGKLQTRLCQCSLRRHNSCNNKNESCNFSDGQTTKDQSVAPINLQSAPKVYSLTFHKAVPVAPGGPAAERRSSTARFKQLRGWSSNRLWNMNSSSRLNSTELGRCMPMTPPLKRLQISLVKKKKILILCVHVFKTQFILTQVGYSFRCPCGSWAAPACWAGRVWPPWTSLWWPHWVATLYACAAHQSGF